MLESATCPNFCPTLQKLCPTSPISLLTCQICLNYYNYLDISRHFHHFTTWTVSVRFLCMHFRFPSKSLHFHPKLPKVAHKYPILQNSGHSYTLFKSCSKLNPIHFYCPSSTFPKVSVYFFPFFSIIQ